MRLYWTNLTEDPEEVIRLYKDHGTSEQFHAEYKSDLNMEQFPSSDYRVNRVLLLLGCLVFNSLRQIGQKALLPSGKCANEPALAMMNGLRLRIRTVINELIRVPGRIIHGGHRIVLSLGKARTWTPTWLRVFNAFNDLLTS